MKLRPSGLNRFELNLFYILCVAVVVSGLAWLYFENFVRVSNDLGVQHHPWQSFTLSAHGVMAWLFVFVMGWLLGIHLRFVWPLRKKRKSGLFLATLATLMCASGFGLYYLADENVRPWTATFHWVVGVIFVIALLGHIYLAVERARPRRKK